jgi:hypothetical protein
VRIDKTFAVKVGKKDDDNARVLDVQVYCLIQNLLDARNVVGVYRATGNAEDDGFLTAATSQATIAGQVDPISFADLYAAKINNPSNYARPRIIRIGALVNF